MASMPVIRLLRQTGKSFSEFLIPNAKEILYQGKDAID